MNKSKLCILFLINTFISCNNSIKVDKLNIINRKEIKEIRPAEIENLMSTYSQVTKFKNNYIYINGDSLQFDDGIKKDFNELINNPSIKDMFKDSYLKGEDYFIKKDYDPGRYRNLNFFKTIYGSSKKNVQDSLVKIIWCPKTVNKVLYVTKVNGVSEKLIKISNILDKKKHLTKYINNPGGTFNWRNIAETDRLSMHSFGITIDINVAYSDYWQWSCKCSNENVDINYENKIPIELIKIFEEHGFIWGGKWYHFDTMHFEYRPELLI